MDKRGLIIKIIAALMVFTLLTACGESTEPTNKNTEKNSSKQDTSSVVESVSDNSSEDTSSVVESTSDNSSEEYDNDDTGFIQSRPWQTYSAKDNSFNLSNSSSSSGEESSSQASSGDSEKEIEKCPYTKEQLIKMLKYLTFDEAERYAIGVGCGSLYVSRQTSTFEKKTGGAPVTYDFEMSVLPYNVTERQLERTVSEMVEFTQKGGIICATNHWLTPSVKLADSTQQGANNSRNKLTRAEFYQVMKPGNQIYENFREELAIGANFFKKLEAVGIPVVYRPMHEANGAWFWWGIGSNDGITGEDVAALYRYVHDYYVKEQGLTNIIWCFCTGLAGNAGERYNWWPGNEYVDISTTDWYLGRVVGNPLESYGDCEGYYNAAQDLVDGLPYGMSEYGWDGSGNASEIPVAETLGFLERRMKNTGAKCAYVGLYFDFGDNQDASLTDKCITLDMMPALWQKLGK